MTPTEKILAVMHSLPLLSQKLKDFEYRPTEFDAERFYRMMNGWSRGERICGLFALHVWSPPFLEEKGEPFQLQEAVQVLSAPQREAIAAWVENPIIP